MNIVSLFDGIGCGLLAAKMVWDTEEVNYYPWEIDRNCVELMKKIHGHNSYGDVKNQNWDDFKYPDLLIGGSPCQGFSLAGKQKGLNDSRSALFWEFLRAIRELKPKYFMLENVKMSKINRDIISEALGVSPIMINANLVSCQNRPRYYWCNFPISSPKDLGLKLDSIIDGFIAMYTERRTEESKIIRKEYKLKTGKDWSPRRGKELVLRDDGKANCLTCTQTKEHIVSTVWNDRYLTVEEWEKIQGLPVDYTSGFSNSIRYKMIGNAWSIPVIEYIFKELKKYIENSK